MKTTQYPESENFNVNQKQLCSAYRRSGKNSPNIKITTDLAKCNIKIPGHSLFLD